MLLETLCITHGVVRHLHEHQARLNRSQATLFRHYEPINLSAIINPPPSDRTIKCRVYYGPKLLNIDYEPYHPRPIRTLKLLAAQVDYAHKWLDRSQLNTLFAQRGDADDILIVRHGLITDTTIANIAFLKRGRWYTPAQPLLHGTTRARLIRSGLLIPKPIEATSLHTFEGFALLNAMVGFLPIKHGKIIQ